MKISKSKVIIATHFLAYSASQALRDFLINNNCNYLLYISHPLPLVSTNTQNRSFAQVSFEKNISHVYKTKLRFNNLLLTSFFEFFLTFIWVFKTNTHYDLFIGINNLNAIQGLFLKKIGVVKKVVYYTIDYFPTRFENKFLNWIYHSIDKFCVKHSDETWNVSNIMKTAREKSNKMIGKDYQRQYEVPIGIWYDKAPRKKFSQINRYKLVFTGHLLAHMGVDLVINSLPLLKEKFPEIKLEIIGTGQDEERLRKLSEKLDIKESVIFHGWVADRGKLENIISTGTLGLATFNTEILDEKVKNADPGKIKDYMALGLPVIATNAISTASTLEKAKCAIIIPYKKEALVKAVTELLKNRELLKKYRENALRYISQFDYNKIFLSNVNRILN